MGLYSYRASKKLKELLEQAGEGGDKERLSLAEEIDVARVMAERAIRLFDGACLGEEASKVSTSLKHASIKNVQECLKLVADLTSQYAKLMLVSDDVFSSTQVEYILAGVTKVLADHIENQAVIDSIINAIGELCTTEKKIGRQVNITIG